MKAKIISRADTDSLDAMVEISDVKYMIRDKLNKDVDVGDEANITFSITLIDDYTTPKSVISAKNDKEKKLQQIAGVKYRAFGEITSLNPLTIDCGITKFIEAFSVNDSIKLGQFVAFDILVLSAYSE